MAYNGIGFVNDNPPAINATNLNKMDNELVYLDGQTDKIKDSTNSIVKEKGYSDNNEISVLENILAGNGVIPKRFPSFIHGNRKLNGILEDSTKTITTPAKIYIKNGDYIVYDNSTYKIDFIGYAAEDSVSGSAETGFVTISPLNLYGTLNKNYMNMNIRRIDGGNLSPDEITNSFYIYSSQIINDLLTVDKSLQAGFAKKVTGKNKFNKNSADIVIGKYYDIGNVERTSNAYEYLANIPCEPSTDYFVNKGYCYVLFYTSTGQYISGLTNSTKFTFETPATAKFITLSYPATARNSLQLEIGTSESTYEDYSYGVNGNEILNKSITYDKLAFDLDIATETIITVNASGGADYTSLRAAIDSITDSSERHKYIVQISKGTYNLRNDYSSAERSAEGFVGLKIPNFVTLLGVNDKSDTIITWDGSGDSPAEEISTLNLQNNCEIYNLTVSANNIRYAIHDDYAIAGMKNYRRIENCDFIGVNLEHLQTYGAGQKGNADWRFKNVQFLSETYGGTGFAVHNNVNQTIDSYFEFDNCKFTGQAYANVYLASLNNGVTALNYAVFKGCRINSGAHIRLNEISAALYGAGIKFKVSGYGNNFGNSDITFGNTDGQDYSSYVDLI